MEDIKKVEEMQDMAELSEDELDKVAGGLQMSTDDHSALQASLQSDLQSDLQSALNGGDKLNGGEKLKDSLKADFL